MKKKIISLLMLLGLSLSFVSGCKSEDSSVVDKLNIDGKDIVLKVGDTKYSADELFNDMLNTTDGADALYDKILKMTVESSVKIDDNMRASWELLLDSFEKEVETYALSNGVKEKEARNQLLAEEGYSSIEEKEEAYYYTVKLQKLQDEYWETRKDYYSTIGFGEERASYFDTMLPYYVKHVLVKTSYTSARKAYNSAIGTEDATNLYEVYKMLEKGEKFNYIMNEKSQDTGSNNTGYGYYMDLTTPFVSEFLHGVYTFDSLLRGKQSEVLGLTSDVLDFYASSVSGENEYGFGFINASDIVTLGDSDLISKYQYTDNNITIYEDVTKDGTTTEKANGTIYGAYGSSSSALYSRTIIFNQTFNNSAINVIAYDLDEELTHNNFKVINIDGEPKKVLTDENKNIVFVVCAKGSGEEKLWVHFLTVNVSPFDEKAKLFFSTNQQETIEEMVKAKENVLTAQQLEDYREELESYKTYVDIKGGTKQSTRNEIIEELESYVKNYAKRGSSDEEEQYLTYDMIEYYMEKGNIEITNDTLEELIEDYIDAKRDFIDLQTMNGIAEGWNDYYENISLYNSPLINSKRIPMECSAYANGDSDSLCKYRYDSGFYIKLTFDVNGGNKLDSAYDNYYYQIGGAEVVLPTNVVKDGGYTFEGWYTTKEAADSLDETKKVTKIENKKSTTKTKTTLYAGWKAVSGEGGAE